MKIGFFPTLHPMCLQCFVQTSEKASGSLWYLPVKVDLPEASEIINRRDPF